MKEGINDRPSPVLQNIFFLVVCNFPLRSASSRGSVKKYLPDFENVVRRSFDESKNINTRECCEALKYIDDSTLKC